MNVRLSGAHALEALQSSHRQKQLIAFIQEMRSKRKWRSCVSAVYAAVQSGVPLTSHFIASAIYACGDARRFDESKKLFFDFHKQLHVEQSLSCHHALLEAAAFCGQWKFAVSFLKELSQTLAARPREKTEKLEDPPSLITPVMLAKTLHACGSGNEESICEGVALFNEFINHPCPNVQVVPTSEVIHELAFLLRRGRRSDKAVKILSFCDRRSIEVLPQTYDEIVWCCHDAQQHLYVITTVERMLKNHISPSESTVRMSMLSAEEVVMYEPKCAARLCYALYRALVANGLPLLSVNYETTIRTCALAEEFELAMTVLNDMVRNGVVVPPYIYDQMWNSRIREAPTFDAAKSLLQGCQKYSKVTTATFNAALACCVRLRDYKGALYIRRVMKRSEAHADVETLKLMLLVNSGNANYRMVLRYFLLLKTHLEDSAVKPLRDRLFDQVKVVSLKAAHTIGGRDSEAAAVIRFFGDNEKGLLCG